VDRNNYYPFSTPRSVKGGIKPTNPYKGFATSWWGKRWIEVLESFQIGQRLLRGRRYARAGQVMEINIKGNKISALVQGSRLTPYEVIIEFKRWDDKTRLKIIDIIASNGNLLGPLFARELPRELESILIKEGINLFPNAYKDLKTSCTCPDWSNPCKHIAAVSYLLALEFDRDPTLILQLRGLPISDIRKKIEEETNENIEESVKGLDDKQRDVLLKLLKKCDIDKFNEIDISKLELVPKKVPLCALNIKRLGVPAFWRSDIDFIKIMEEVYKGFSDWGKDKSI